MRPMYPIGIACKHLTLLFNRPPHAKFHNGQTMTFGALLGALTLFNTWRNPALSQATVLTTAIFGGMYSLAGLSAFLYPGSKGTDPEFGETYAQFYIFGTILTVDMLGWWLESSRLTRLGIH